MSGDIPSIPGAQYGALGALLLVASVVCTPKVTRKEPVAAAASSSRASRILDAGQPATSAQEWVIDNTSSIRGLTPTVVGAPVITPTSYGPALCFDGDDAIVIPKNPLQGLQEFTLEVLFRCDPVTPAEAALSEPRFLHIETETASRALIEARVDETSFALDTFLLSNGERRTLLDMTKRHPVGVWHFGALSYADGQMRHFVDGVEDASGTVALAALGPGKTSIGARQNLVRWFKGCVRKLIITPLALSPALLKRP